MVFLTHEANTEVNGYSPRLRAEECRVTLEVAAAVLLAADATDDSFVMEDEIHSSRAGGDDELAPWGQLLTGLPGGNMSFLRIRFKHT